VSTSPEHIFHGIATCEGIVIGTAYVFHALVSDVGDAYPSYTITDDQTAQEAERFETALELTRQQIRDIKQEYLNKAGAKNAKIFDAHLLLLEDTMIIEKVHKRIHDDKENAEAAFAHVANTLLHSFSQIPDKYLGERIEDIRDVVRRVMHNLIGTSRPSLAELENDVIVIAHDLSPSDTATMHQERVVGIVTEIGGPTSHTSIMARALEVPAVAGATAITSHVKDNDLIIVDGIKGVIILHPTEERITEYRQLQQSFMDRKARLTSLLNQPAITTDDRHIKLLANIELPEEVTHALERGAEGVGLYRTEYLFMNRQDLPSEDEQYEAYSYVAERCGDRPLVIRTLDLGGDKFVSSLTLPREMNPFMGWRAIRLCLERTDIFKTQLRAILRASSHGNVRAMFPMITTVQEVRLARQLIREVTTELLEEGCDLNPDMLVGAMIEIPSAALIADVLAREVDFFSIGTNDLIQYTLAIDRVNEKTAQMYDPMNLAVLRLLKIIIDAAHCRPCRDEPSRESNPACPIGHQRQRNPIPVCVCGEMASEPAMAFLLVGLGVDELSTVATSIPSNKELIRAMNRGHAADVVEQVLNCDDPEKVRALVNDQLAELKLT
jgi:phosphotransferase system enzyme I (PtsI)